MIDRCERPGKCWESYGGRGIKVCNRWRHNFLAFLADMGRKPSPGLTLDRKNNDKNYSPSNCRWATRSEQAQNKRPRVVPRLCWKGLHRKTAWGRCKRCWKIWYENRKEKA